MHIFLIPHGVQKDFKRDVDAQKQWIKEDLGDPFSQQTLKWGNQYWHSMGKSGNLYIFMVRINPITTLAPLRANTLSNIAIKLNDFEKIYNQFTP